jgi:hypothetical protein
MRRLMISAFAAVALLAAATTIVRLQTPTTDRPAVTTGMMSLQELHSKADVNKLPIEDSAIQ